jgi:hypothetical protein
MSFFLFFIFIIFLRALESGTWIEGANNKLKVRGNSKKLEDQIEI